MTRWLVWAEHVVGEVEADCRREAERAAVGRYGAAAVARVQSVVSWAVQQEEEGAAAARRRRVEA